MPEVRNLAIFCLESESHLLDLLFHQVNVPNRQLFLIVHALLQPKECLSNDVFDFGMFVGDALCDQIICQFSPFFVHIETRLNLSSSECTHHTVVHLLLLVLSVFRLL